jgi:O-antigen/teichoic acid export membrane protein
MVGRNADRTIISAISLDQLTVYTVSCRISEVMSDILTPMVSTTLPQLTRAHNEPKKFSGLIVRNGLIAVSIGCSFILIPASFGHCALTIWLDKDTLAGSPNVDIVVLCMGLYRVFELLYSSLASPFYAAGQVQRLIVFSTFNAAVTAGATYFAYMKGGLVGVGLMNAAIGIAQFVPLLLVVKNLAGATFGLKAFMSRCAEIIVASVGVALLIHAGLDKALFLGHEKLAILAAPILGCTWISLLCLSGICPIPDPILRRLPRYRSKAAVEEENPTLPSLAEFVEEVDISTGDLGGSAIAPHDIGKPDLE